MPLHLTDPEAPNFRPESCATLHDITRFCHEQAVREMFRFGEAHDFPQRASRRMTKDGATQFWIVDRWVDMDAAFRQVRDALREQLAPLLKARLQSEQV